MAAFEELGLCPEIVRAVAEAGWTLPTPIQADTIPLILGGSDVCAAAETGSGKTGAFTLPALQVVHETLRNKSKAAPRTRDAEFFNPYRTNPRITTEGPLTVSLPPTKKAEWLGTQSKVHVRHGLKVQAEFEILSMPSDGALRFGVTTETYGFDSIGTRDNPESFGYGFTGKVSWNGSFIAYPDGSPGTVFGERDIVGVLLDRSKRTIAFQVNGKNLGVAFTYQPNLDGHPWYFALSGRNALVKANDKFIYPDGDFTPVYDVHDIVSTATGKRSPLLLMLEPTKELANQTFGVLKKFCRVLMDPPVSPVLAIGGIPTRDLKQTLSKGADAVVGTLGRVRALIDDRTLELRSLRFLVLDEADELTKDLADIQCINHIKKCANESVQVLFFSATLFSRQVKETINQLTTHPTWVDHKGRPCVPEAVQIVKVVIDPKRPPSVVRRGAKPSTDGVHAGGAEDERMSQTVKLIKPEIALDIADEYKMDQCLIFCRTNLDCDNFEKYLTDLGGSKFRGKKDTGKENPYSCVVLAGQRTEGERHDALKSFMEGDVRFLICTDVGARGLDISGLPFSIMMTVSEDTNMMFHRIGRVGRADRMGLAIIISSSEKEKVWYHKCNKGWECKNRKLTSEGGCCIWINESQYIREFEDIISDTVPKMDLSTFTAEGVPTPNKRPPPVGSTRKSGRWAKGNQTVTYGQDKDKGIDIISKRRFDDLAPSLAATQLLDAKVQCVYLSNKFL